MAGLVEAKARTSIGDTLAGLAARSGSAAHPYRAACSGRSGHQAARNFADAVHLLAMVHAERPGLLDLVAAGDHGEPATAWVAKAGAAFAVERSYLTRLVVAAGPLPGTPGQAGTDAALIGQRSALDMLARSGRAGCSIGAAIGLVLDWPAVRVLLDAAAERFGVPVPACALPSVRETLEVAGLAAADQRVQRALCFGVEQLLLQHRALWDLAEARCAARGES